MSKTILYLSYDGMTDQLGQSQVLPYLCGLSKKGYVIHLVSCEKKERFEVHKNLIQNIVDENNIAWYPLKYYKSPPILSTLFDIRQLIKKAEALHAIYKFDVVHCRSYITSFAGQWMKKKYGTKFIFDMRGFYADERVDGNIWKQSNPIFKFVYNYFKKKEKQFLQQADQIVSLTHNAKKIIDEWKLNGNNSLPINVIPCCADLSHFDYNNFTADFIDKKKQSMGYSSDDKVMVYLGAIGTWYMLPQMLDCYKIFRKNNQKIKLLFITNEPAEIILKQVTQKSIDSNDVKIISATRNEVPPLLSICQYSIFFITPTFSKQASSPTKQGEIMGMGIPIICNSGVGDTDYIIEQTHSGVLVPQFTDLEYQKAYERIENTSFEKAKTRQGANQFYSLQKGVEAYENIYLKI